MAKQSTTAKAFITHNINNTAHTYTHWRARALAHSICIKFFHLLV